LSYEAYAHFTSPIRRYPDLLTHRAIKAILQGKRYDPRGIEVSELNTQLSPAGRRKAAQDKASGKKKLDGDYAIWESLGVHCSANERRADEASRDVEAWLKCYFIRDRLGEEFTGTISGVAPFGIFVQLDTLFIEGLVHVTELGADYFQYDDARHELRGERTGMRYQLTDRVTVQVSRVDLDARKIDLRLVNEPGIHTQLKNEARRADGEQGGRKKKRGKADDAPASGPAAPGGEPADMAQMADTPVDTRQAPRRARGGNIDNGGNSSSGGNGGNGGNRKPRSAAGAAPKARTSRKSAGDKAGGKKKRQK
jgi:ribonuclease R